MASHTLSLEIDDTELYAEAPTPANGDPYVAVVMKTNEQGVSIEQETITLGTGFESINDIAWELKQMLEQPDQYDHGIDFVPDRAEVFGIAGSVGFASLTHSYEYTVEIKGESFTFEAESKLDARYRAADKFKEQLDSSGVDINMLAVQAKITNTEVNTNSEAA